MVKYRGALWRAHGVRQPDCAGCRVKTKSRISGSVSTASMRSCNHKSDLFVFIDFIEKSPRPYSIPPRIRGEVFEFFNIRPKMRMFTQLRVDKITKLLSNFAVSGSSDLFKVFLKLFGLEYSILIQQSALLAIVHPGNPA